MSRPVVTVPPDLPARAALVLLLEHRYAALPVLVDDRVIGIVSESNLLNAATRGTDLSATVADIMTAPAVTMPTTATMAELTATLLDHGLRSLPIVNDEEFLIGIVARADLLRTLIYDDDITADRVRRILHTYTGSRPRWNIQIINGVVQVTGEFTDQAERRLITALAHTVPGVHHVQLHPTTPATA